jgi:hypothetical protein
MLSVPVWARDLPLGRGVGGVCPGGVKGKGDRAVTKRDLKVIEREEPVGIVIQDREEPAPKPAITAFIWGGKVRSRPTLPFGRWKPATN